MFGRALGMMIVFGVAIGVLFPREEKPGASPPAMVEARHAALVTGKAESSDEDRRGNEVVLRRREDGHFYADVEVNGTEIEFMIDTGASGIALTRRDAEKLGLFWNENDLDVVGRGVSGAVSGTMVRLDRVELGDREARDLPAAIIPEGLDVSLLGQSFLSRIGEVRINGDEMLLR